ncbi:MAG: amidohydrolase family protein, partial [Afipia sp.]
MTSKGESRALSGLMTARTSKRIRSLSLLSSAILIGLCQTSLAQKAPEAPGAAPSAVTLFQNVRIFDGKNAQLSEPSNVLVRGNQIERISTSPIPVDRSATTRIIDGGGKTLMPGLIDAHWHAMLIRATPAQAFGDVGYNNLQAGDEATDTLMRGFTTVRDVGGPAFGLKQAIDEGIVRGPRIYP